MSSTLSLSQLGIWHHNRRVQPGADLPEVGNYSSIEVKVFSFLDANSAKHFGAEMARFYIERMPLNTPLKDKQFAAKSLKILEQMDLQIKSYKRENKLNLYKVAQMGNAFKWSLKDAGYEDGYVDKLTQWFVVAVKA